MRPLAILVGVVLTVIVACSGRVTPPECKEIGSRCHIEDNATAVQRECHENAHDKWTAAECTSNRTRCFDACPPGDGGH